MSRVLTLRPPVADQGPDDPWLVAACALGDKAALARLYGRHHALVTRVATRMTPPGTDVEELVQLTFLAAWNRAGAFRRESSVRAWLSAIAANLAWKVRRSERRRRSALAVMESQPRDTQLELEEEAQRRDLVSRVHDALGRLPHSMRTLYVMCDVEDHAIAEVALVLGMSTSTAWRRLQAARQKLLALVQESS